MQQVDNLMDITIRWVDNGPIRSLVLNAISIHEPTPDNGAYTHTLHYAFPHMDATDIPKPYDMFLTLKHSQVMQLQNTGGYEAVVALLDQWIKG